MEWKIVDKLGDGWMRWKMGVYSPYPVAYVYQYSHTYAEWSVFGVDGDDLVASNTKASSHIPEEMKREAEAALRKLIDTLQNETAK